MNLTFVGGGNMATAIIGGLIQRGWDKAQLSVVEIVPAAREKLTQTFGVRTLAGISEIAQQATPPDCVVLAIKPQQMREVACELAPHIKNTLVVTIAAGIRAGDLARWLGHAQQAYTRIVRVMPNTPALVLAGVSGLYALPAVSSEDRECAASILAAVGETVWVEKESDIDAVTAVSGSGPAYVFYFIEALEQAGRDMGLSAAAARQLALATFTGSSKLAAQSSEDAATLRARVTSKGGTTERAIASMEGAEIKAAIIRAVKAAQARSEELGNELGKD